MDIGAPTCVVMDRILTREKGDVSLKKLTEVLAAAGAEQSINNNTSSVTSSSSSDSINQVSIDMAETGKKI